MNVALAALLVALACLAPASAADRAPPTAKEMIRYLLASRDVSLSVDPSCKGVGSDFKDKSIGDYVSGLLAEQVGGDGKNWIETSAEPRAVAGKASAGVWQCKVTFRRHAGEERWGWGVAFSVRAADRKVLPGSFRCTGGG